ncbi:MAG TPA: EamA family transporter [Terriglobia bacterium]|nr:EamA family transporter [Terriglobia bacterium]
MTSSPRSPLQPLAFALLCGIWGSTWLAIKVGYGGIGAFNVAALRFFVAGALFVPIAFVLRAPWPRGSTEWGVVAVVGVFLFALDYGLIYWGEQWLETGLAAVLFAVNPIVTAIAAHLYVPGERLTLRKLGGTLLAFLGVAGLFADKLQIDSSKLAPMVAILVAAAFATIATVVTKRHGGALHPAALNAPAMLIGAALLAVASFAAGDGLRTPRDPAAWWAIGYLAIAGSIVTFLLYFRLLKTWSATTLSFIAVFTPLVALVLGYIALGERPTVFVALGTALILLGVWFAVTKRSEL